MSPAHEACISVTRRAFNFDGVIRLARLVGGAAFEAAGVPTAGDTRTLSFKATAAHVNASEVLDDREVEAAIVLRAFYASRTYANAMRVGAKLFRRRTFRRAVAKASSEDVENVGRMNEQLAKQVGGTRPVDPLSPLCAALCEKGMTPTEIVKLLDSLGLERATSEGARARVKERVARWNTRRRTA